MTFFGLVMTLPRLGRQANDRAAINEPARVRTGLLAGGTSRRWSVYG